MANNEIENFFDVYKSLEACIPDLLNFVYNDRNLSYIMLESEKEE